MANKDELLNKLIDYLKDNYDCTNQDLEDEFGFGMITLTNYKGKQLSIGIDEDIIGDCCYVWFTHTNSRLTHSNFGHLVNTAIRMFMNCEIG